MWWYVVNSSSKDNNAGNTKTKFKMKLADTRLASLVRDKQIVTLGLWWCLVTACLSLTACRQPNGEQSSQSTSNHPPSTQAATDTANPVAQAIAAAQGSQYNNKSQLSPNGCLAATSFAAAPQPTAALSGKLGLWVAEIDPQTLQTVRVVAQNPRLAFPLASTYKQAVLWALLREFDAGRLSPEERFNVTQGNQSLGSYPFDGTNTKELSSRMIAYSDNTATDILHRKVGIDKVQQTADQLGLCQTRVILPTKDWWYLQINLENNKKRIAQWIEARKDERLRLAQQIDQETQANRADYIQAKLNIYFENRYQLDDDLKVHNYSTPQEWANYLAHFYLKPGLSERASQWQGEVMQSGFGRSALNLGQHKIKRFGGKGGNGWKILTYSGYLETEDGKHIVYSFMQHGCYQDYTIPNTRAAFGWISAAIRQVLSDELLDMSLPSATSQTSQQEATLQAHLSPPPAPVSIAPTALPSSLGPDNATGAQEVEVELPELTKP